MIVNVRFEIHKTTPRHATRRRTDNLHKQQTLKQRSITIVRVVHSMTGRPKKNELWHSSLFAERKWRWIHLISLGVWESRWPHHVVAIESTKWTQNIPIWMQWICHLHIPFLPYTRCSVWSFTVDCIPSDPWPWRFCSVPADLWIQHIDSLDITHFMHSHHTLTFGVEWESNITKQQR